MKTPQGILETSKPVGTPVEWSSSAPDVSDGRVPLMLGVTGMRTIEHPARAKEVVVEQMRRLKRRYPNTPFAILSALAPGADQMVARAALDVLDAQLFVPLPMPLASYRETFATDAARQQFGALLDVASSVIELERDPEAGTPAKPGTRYEVQYARAAAFITDRCQILFALHDGTAERTSQDRVGTATIIEWVEDGRIPLAYLPTESQDRPFYYPNETQCLHISPRTGTVNRLEDVYGAIAPSLERIDRFNADIGELPPAAVEQSRRYIVGDHGDHAALQTPSVRALTQRYVHADALAMTLKSRFHQYLRGVYALSAGAIITFPLIEVWVYSMMFSFLFAALAVGIVVWTRQCDMENRFLHARALAEGLRIATFWSIAGLPDHVHDHFINKYAGHLAWTRLALQNVETVSRMGMQGHAIEANYELVEILWVADQCKYFGRAQYQTRNLAQRLDRGANLLLGCVLVYAVGVFTYLWAGTSWTPPTIQLMAIGIEMPLAFAVSLKAYKSKLGLEPLLRHYEKAYLLFETAHQELQAHRSHRIVQDATGSPSMERPVDSPSGASRREVLVQLGEEAILENGEWLWMNQNRNIETPAL